MKLLKRVVCLMLLSALVCSALAFAEQTPQQLATEELNKLSVMVGNEAGDLMLQKPVTRAEMATILCRLSGLEQAAKDAGITSSPFSDVPTDHWASGYIQVCKQNGVINGYPDGTFLPEQEISYAEVLKMLVAVLGYLPKAESKGEYPHGVLMMANELGITNDLVLLAEKPAIRSDVALFSYRALDIPLLMQVSFGEDAQYQVMEGVTLRSTHFGGK
ncbi:MAG: S-layer homology domain-containing protein [Clostridia bacterium]|nr:S-layer homology domain-containing protein [Clostridia bacterium]